MEDTFILVLQRTHLLQQMLNEITDHALADDSPRVRFSAVGANLATEHWLAMTTLMESRRFASAIALIRLQYESLLRSVWCLHCAVDDQIETLSTAMSEQSQESAKRWPTATAMLEAIGTLRQTTALHASLCEFKDGSWTALNSFIHAGLHPLVRQAEGYPYELLLQTMRISNGLGLLTAMQKAVLTDRRDLQKIVLTRCESFTDCLPPRKEPCPRPPGQSV